MGTFGSIGRSVSRLQWRRILVVLSLVAGATAALLARGSSPAFLPGRRAWAGSNWQYGILLIAWSATIGLAPALCRALRQPLPLILGVVVAWASYRIGYSMLPIGGYDFYARIPLYIYSFFSGIAFFVSCRLVSEEKLGEAWSTRIATWLPLVFIILCGMFAGAQEGRLSPGPAWLSAVPDRENGSTEIEQRVLHERPYSSGMYLAVQPELGPSGTGALPVVVLNSRGEGVVIDLDQATASEFQLSTAIASVLLGRPPEERVYACLGDLAISYRDSAAVQSDTGGSMRIEGRISLESASIGRIPVVEFVADIGLQGSSSGIVTIISAQASSDEEWVGRFDDPVVHSVRVLKDCVAGPPGSSLRLSGDLDGLTLLNGEQVVWRFSLPLSGVRADGTGAIWARPTGNGGLVFAVERREWRDPGWRGSYAGYMVYTLYYVGPK